MAALPLSLYFLGLAAGIVALPLASRVTVDNILAISEKRRLRQSILGFMVLALSTSLPELIVAINAIIIGNMAGSLGDILGSNIVNVALVLGLSLVVASFRFPKKIVIGERERREFVTGLMILSITLLSLLYIQYVGRFIGVGLLVTFASYSYLLFKRRRIETETVSKEPMASVKREVALTILGLVFVVISARVALESAIEIALFFEIPASIIGATLVAFGTSLPELSVDVRSAYRGYVSLSFGDIIGSCLLNTTLIMGLLLTFTPFGVNMIVLSDLILFSVISNLFLWYFIDTERLNRSAGLALLALYCLNMLTLLGILQLRSIT